MRSTWLKLLALFIGFSLIAAACGDDDDDDGDAADGGDTTGETDVVETTTTAGAETTTTVAAETDGGTDEEEMAPPCEATVPGTEITIAPFFTTASYNPPYSSGTLVGGDQLVMIYDVLARYNPETNDFEPHLAESFESNDDFTVWTLKLREGVAYDDGTPLDAQMVIDNMNRYLEPVADQRIINTGAPFVALIESMTAVDDLTVEFTLSTPWATFPFLLNDEPGMIVNLNAIGDDPIAFGSNPPATAGVGPYILSSLTPGESAVFTARDNYWGGPVCVETITVNIAASGAITGPAASYEAFNNGDVDMAFLRSPGVNAEAIADGANVDQDLQQGFQYVIFNMREGTPLNDPILREGIALSIDVDIINDRAYGGSMEVAKSYFAESSPYYSDAIEAIPTDPTRGAELIAESGFTGTLRMLCSNGPEAVETSLAVEAMLEAAGLTIEVENIGVTDQIARLATGDYDIGCWGVNAGGDTSVSAMFRNFYSTSATNRVGFNDPEMDALLEEALAAPIADLPEILAEINNKLVTEFIGVPVGVGPEGMVIAENVLGVKRTGSTMFMFDDAYIAE